MTEGVLRSCRASLKVAFDRRERTLVATLIVMAILESYSEGGTRHLASEQLLVPVAGQ
jgi:hypothetical protein